MIVLTMAASLFPLGLVYAQDYEAIQKRLGQAVKSGEISRAQAGAMLEALKGSRKDKQAKETPDQQYAQAEERIKAAVEAGQVTKEQAEKRLKMLAERLRRGGQQKTDRDTEAKKREYMAAAEKIEAMVKEGKVSKEDAEKRLGQMRARMFPSKGKAQDKPQDMDAKKRGYMERARRIEAAVEAGQLSKEDAEKRLLELRKAMFPEAGDQEGEKANEKASGESDEKANGQRRRRLLRRNGGEA
ncbi:MAG: hypothetical protein MK108_06440 [Mariniblastus sp.]|nr:hypothetical protein [Mariniblastus sp.]